MKETRVEKHQERHRKKMDVDEIKRVAKVHAEQFIQKIKIKAKTKWDAFVAAQVYRKQAKHRKTMDSEKVEKMAEKVILKTALICIKIVLPIVILGFLFFEFGGWIKDGVEVIAGVIGKIVTFFQLLFHIVAVIVQWIQQLIAAFKQPSS